MSVFRDEKYRNLGGSLSSENYTELTDDTIYLIQKMQIKYENINQELKTENKKAKDKNTFYLIILGIAFYVGTKY
tara:strand:+ start:361 stop:585 length:225 start_codon:yes stop_codon:yes gene_type:complete